MAIKMEMEHYSFQMVINILGNLKMTNLMVKEQLLTKMEICISDSFKITCLME